jgi:hypothetical protein
MKQGVRVKGNAEQQHGCPTLHQPVEGRPGPARGVPTMVIRRDVSSKGAGRGKRMSRVNTPDDACLVPEHLGQKTYL